MSDETKNDERRKLVREALRTIDDLQARLDIAQGAMRAPIAIVGIGCRYPGGVTNPDSFWRLLCNRTDAINEVPADRWDISAWYDADRSAPGKMSTRWGGFLNGVELFDAQFFGIAPREAAMLDPQHRILLEVAWEALEQAGFPFADLPGSQTGIFMGMTNNEYYQDLLRSLEPAALSPYLATGNVLNAAAGRLAYFLGTHGPSVAVDTACSSSLTAVHLACQSLRAGDCKTALAGGVNVILVPETGVMFSKWGMMAADGRCKSFDAAADGFVRSEGCGVVVLKKLSDAVAAGDRVLAVIEGSAVNQDGRSSGLTVPNGVAQQALIRQALTNASLEPGQIDYIEAHGTGTSLGDPIEVDALFGVFGPGRDPRHKLKIGSVKTNLGHTESASGVAGLIKCVLALEHGQIPAQLHFHKPTPEIAWDTMPIEVVSEPIPWPRGDRPRRAGVSSFGFSGANAHVVLAEPPEVVPVTDAAERPRHILAFSARDPQALAELAERYASTLHDQPGVALKNFCFTVNSGRAHFRHRASVSAQGIPELAAALSRFAAADEPAVIRGQWTGEPTKVAFLFTGQGSQYVGMGRQLYDSQPVFRAELDRCAALLVPHLDRPLLDLLFAPADRAADLNQTCYTQPALFSVEWSLAQLWRSWGVEPAAMLGHSVGEYVAACQSGVMSLEEGLRLIAARARLMQSLPSNGMMAAVATDEQTVSKLLAPHAATAAIAAINGPRSVVISGRADTVSKILEQLQARQIPAVPLAVSHAFHSPLLDPILDSFEQTAAQIQYNRPRTPIAANVTGSFAQQDEVASAGYWRRHARSPVRFADGIRELHRKGCQLFLEIGPAPVLINMGRKCVDESGQGWFPSLVRGSDEWTQMLQSLSQLYVRGVPIDWSGFDRGYTRRRLALPTYPFQRKRFWVDKEKATPTSGAESVPSDAAEGGLRRLPGSPLVREIIYSVEMGTRLQPWLADHIVAGQVVVPMTAYVDMALVAGVEILQSASITIEDLILRERLVVPADTTAHVQLVLSPAEAKDSWNFRIISLEATTPAGWIQHAGGSLRKLVDAPTALARYGEGVNGNALAAVGEEIGPDAHYQKFAAQGIDFGPTFRGVQRVTLAGGKAVGDIVRPRADGTGIRNVFHPAFLDACLQPMVHSWAGQTESGSFLPFAVERIDVWGVPTSAVKSYCHARGKTGEQADTLVGDATLRGEDGAVVATVRGLTVRRSQNVASSDRVADWLYEVEWRPAAAVTASPGSPSQMPDAAVALTLATQNLPRYLQQAFDAGFANATKLLEACSLRFVTMAMESLGWNAKPGDAVRLLPFARQLGVLPRHERLLARLLDILVAAGCCEVAPDGWLVKQPLENLNASARLPAASVAAAAAANRTFAAELKLLDTCGARLADVLRGKCDPLELLFGPGSAETLEKIYAESLTTSVINQVCADVFAGIARSLPTDGKIRVLEIGAGTGGTTAHVLKHLPAERTEYCFTDISPSLIGRARSRFASYPFIEFDVLDIERELEPQGFANRRFDVILASNVLHATADLRGVLARVRELLAPGGLLVLAEGTRPQSWIDLTFGLTDGWWKFTDTELRPDYPLLDVSNWLRLLEEQGFTGPVQLAGPAVEGNAPDYTVFVAGGIAAQPRGSESDDLWLVFVDEQGVGNEVAAELKHQGGSCLTVYPGTEYQHFSEDQFRLDPTRRDDYIWLLEDIARSGRQCAGIAHLWSLNAVVPGAASSEQLIEAQDSCCRSLLYLTQSLVVRGESLKSGLWAVTRGSQSVGDEVQRLNSAQATTWGLGKVLALEHPELRVARLDLPVALPATPEIARREAKQIAALLLRPLESSQWAMRAGELYVARLARKKREITREPQTLVVTEMGRLDSLEWRPSNRRPPGAGQIEIQVVAVGLNFRDVLSALGMYPGDAGPSGGEVAGVVAAVGAGASNVVVGDAVAALAIGGFSDYVITSADLAIKKPVGWSFADIVTVPAAFSTAYHALVQLANVQAGERVLIHAAAGGVGLAAIQLAQQLGCEILATAGSDEKRNYLRSLGVSHVFDSRSLTFANDVHDLVGEAGVDVIVNTLSGDLIEASILLLSKRGRFVELGKRDIWDPSRFAEVRPDAAYYIVDLAARSQTSPSDFRPIFAAASAAIATGTFRPLPMQVFTRDRVQAAFRHMAQAKHIGKIVVAVSRADHVCATGPAPRHFDANAAGSYLVTGGLAGLGLRTAQWLAARGAQHLVLMARSEPTEAATRALEAIRKAGVQVLVYRGDVSQMSDVKHALDAIRSSLPPLCGIIHSAGVLDDGAILQQEWPRFQRVFAPKVAGAWNLHVATLGMPLDLFVCYSSASAILGSPGQSNHAAANAFLDALAHHRRGLGLPGLSINWGAWSDIGAAQRRQVFDRVADFGVAAIPPDDGIAALERLIVDGSVQSAVVPMDWKRFLETERPPAERSFFAELGAAPVARKIVQEINATASLESQLQNARPSDRRKLIQTSVRDAVVGVLGLDQQTQLDPLQSFRDLGFDSLMSIELRNRLQKSMGRQLPATLAFDFPSLASMTDYFCQEWMERTGEPQPFVAPSDDLQSDSNVAELGQLSSAETEKLLLEELARTRELLS
jgi:acyl transferase domain-containing protein/NADPH:quinone reductase-like Zn-dependent oxidoreductase/SAM-dependent methyltransferase/acyl carrier protein